MLLPWRGQAPPIPVRCFASEVLGLRSRPFLAGLCAVRCCCAEAACSIAGGPVAACSGAVAASFLLDASVVSAWAQCLERLRRWGAATWGAATVSFSACAFVVRCLGAAIASLGFLKRGSVVKCKGEAGANARALISPRACLFPCPLWRQPATSNSWLAFVGRGANRSDRPTPGWHLRGGVSVHGCCQFPAARFCGEGAGLGSTRPAPWAMPSWRHGPSRRAPADHCS